VIRLASKSAAARPTAPGADGLDPHRITGLLALQALVGDRRERPLA